jgi:hypothetical protein
MKNIGTFCRQYDIKHSYVDKNKSILKGWKSGLFVNISQTFVLGSGPHSQYGSGSRRSKISADSDLNPAYFSYIFEGKKID